MPFYRELISRESAGRLNSHVIIVAPDDMSDLREMAGTSVGAEHLLADTGLASIAVTATPTLLLVGSDGTISKAWVGEVAKGFCQNYANRPRVFRPPFPQAPRRQINELLGQFRYSLAYSTSTGLRPKDK